MTKLIVISIATAIVAFACLASVVTEMVMSAHQKKQIKKMLEEAEKTEAILRVRDKIIFSKLQKDLKENYDD